MTDDPSQWTFLVDSRIVAEIAHSERLLEATHDAGKDINVALRTATRGGKRLRAHLLLAAHAAMGGDDHEAAMGAAAALELFQSAALIHDDVIDDSETRRGEIATHRLFSSVHRDHAWPGSADTFGVAGAILAGDVALLASMRCFDRSVSGLDASSRSLATSLFHDMTQLVTAGQYLDVRIAATGIDSLAGQGPLIEATMRTKTATYTAEYPLGLGAAIAGADEQTVNRWRTVGVPLGMAFQIRDDVLGILGSPESTGKPVGDDLREGKRTVLVHHAWIHADDVGRATLSAAIGNPAADPSTIEAGIDVLRETGAFDHAEQTIETLRADATDLLTAVAPSGPMLDYLHHIIDAATQRVA